MKTQLFLEYRMRGQLGLTEDVDRFQKIPLCVIPAKAGIQWALEDKSGLPLSRE